MYNQKHRATEVSRSASPLPSSNRWLQPGAIAAVTDKMGKKTDIQVIVSGTKDTKGIYTVLRIRLQQ